MLESEKHLEYEPNTPLLITQQTRQPEKTGENKLHNNQPASERNTGNFSIRCGMAAKGAALIEK